MIWVLIDLFSRGKWEMKWPIEVYAPVAKIGKYCWHHKAAATFPFGFSSYEVL
jgi:hypothetical protein